EIENIKEFCVESNYIVALNHSKELYGWGNQSYIVYGGSRNYPYKDTRVSNVEKIATWSDTLYILDSTGVAKTIGYSYNGSGGYPAPSTSSSYQSKGYNAWNTSYRTLEFYNTAQTKLINLFAFYHGCMFFDESDRAYCIGENNMKFTSSSQITPESELRFSSNSGIYHTYSDGVAYTCYQWTYKLIRCSVFDSSKSVVGNSKNILSLLKNNSTFRCTGSCLTYGQTNQNWSSYLSDNCNGAVSLGNEFILKNYSGESVLKGYGKSNNGEFGSSTSISNASNYDTGLKDIKDIIVKGNTVVVVDKNNNIYVTGMNQNNKLGIGEYNNEPVKKFTNITEQSNSFIFMDDIKEITTSR
ncbi:chromosome condensation regulator, partial [Clostridioides difficile]|nr:chromosome condensation regulator [Clostridioides difficile]